MAEVYALCRECDDTVRYIGWTSKTAEERFRQHIRNRGTVRYKTPLYDWMRKYSDVKVIVLFSELTNDEAREKEIALISQYGLENLLNLLEGGAGAVGWKHSEETKEKIRQTHLGVKRSEETRRKISEANKGRAGRPLTEEEKAHLSKVFTGRYVSEETRKKRSEALSGRTFTDEQKKRMSEGQKRRFSNPAERERYSKMFLGKAREKKVPQDTEGTTITDGA